MDQHSILISNLYSSGAREWHCPTCGRRILFTRTPTRQMIELEPGDTDVVHVGTCSGPANNISEFDEWMDSNQDLWQKPLT